MEISSELRHCRRRTQSEPPKGFQRSKFRLYKTAQVDETSHELDDNISGSKSDEMLLSSSSSRLLRATDRCRLIEEENGSEEYVFCKLCLKEKEKHVPSQFPCPHQQTQKLPESKGELQSKYVKHFSLDFDNYPPDQIYEYTDSNKNDTSCFPKFGCCKKPKRKPRFQAQNSHSSNNSNNNNNSTARTREYTRLLSTSSCTSNTLHHASLQTISTNFSNSSGSRSITTFSDTSAENLSRDSGFDEPPCLLNLIDVTHKCKGLYSCKKKDYFNLNMHLKALMNCMPKPYSETEALPHKLTNCGREQRSPYLSKRRNAICETSDEMRVKFHEALCAFVTLQAMAKYELL